MDATIATFLIQDGITNGAIYALLGLALVLVFAVTRIIFIPQGEFVAYGALSLALLDSGQIPGTVPMLICFGVAAMLFDLWGMRHAFVLKGLITALAVNIVLPLVIYGIVAIVAPLQPPALVRALMAILIIAPMGYYIYKIIYRPLADATVLTLLIASLGVHLFLMGLGLVFFGPEGLRARPLTEGSILVGPMVVTTQSLWIYGITILIIIGLYLFFERTLLGKALRATAVNRLGARLVGVRTQLTGATALVLAAIIGAVSGVLIAPVTTIYYDTGFLIGLKGFVAAILGGLGNFPLTAIAALGVGIVEAFSSFFASAYKEIIVFGLIVPVLVWLSFGAGHHEED